MLEGLLRSPGFAAFLLAGVVLALTPGPGVAYLLTQTLSRGPCGGDRVATRRLSGRARFRSRACSGTDFWLPC